jgi:hypothetical protein
MLNRFRPYLIGLLSYTPLGERYLIHATGGTDNARYCYAVFMRHLKYAFQGGMQNFPQTIAELGPGDSIGTGLCWLIAGADRYYAFDVENYTQSSRTLAIFDELVTLFNNRTPVPGQAEHPELKPRLDDLEFPTSILTEERLRRALDPRRLEGLRTALEGAEPGEYADSPIRFVVPWDYQGNVQEGTVDLIYSQAVMEHVDDLDKVYRCSYEWLKPGGMISHQIDFKAHGTSQGWDGYRAYSELGWKVIRGNRPYLINRVSSSGQLEAIRRHGFRVVNEISAFMEPTLTTRQHAKRFRDLDHDTRRTAGLFVQAVLETDAAHDEPW